MPVSLSIGSHRPYTVSESRLQRILTQDENQATHLCRWDRIKDHFRSEKKKDVINELYRLTHRDELPTDSILGESICIFNRIKEMANPVARDIFKIEDRVDSENITFAVGNTVIYRQARDTLSAGDQAFLDRYYLDQANTDTTLGLAFLDGMRMRLDGRLSVKGEGDTAQLFNDIGRYAFQFDGMTIFEEDGVSIEDKRAYLKKFLEKLTDPQKKSLNVVGSQLGSMTLRDTLLVPPESRLVFIGEPDKATAYHLDEKNKMLTVDIKIWQSPDLDHERFNVLREAYDRNSARWYAGLSLKASFSITESGVVNCQGFQFSDQSEPI